MAGGKGTRIASEYKDIPKPMIYIENKPILGHQLFQFKKYGYEHFIIVVGYLGDQIVDYFGNGSNLGIDIEYFVEKEPLGTAGALPLLSDKLGNDFFLVNGDLLFDIDINKFYYYHRLKGGIATILTHPNNHPYDSAIVITNEEDQVVNLLCKEGRSGWFKNQINAGMHLLSTKIFDYIKKTGYIDFDRDILSNITGSKKIFAYHTIEYVTDLGTPERLKNAIIDYRKRIPEKKSLRNKKKAIFLDRDGVINKEKGIIKDINEFELSEHVIEALRIINQSEYLAIVITNQPVIARGELTIKGLKEIHNKMETLIGREMVYIDDIYFCPHHPHKGYEGERTELKIECECRKPKPGMIFAAAEKHNISLNESWMVGNDIIDIEAGINAGCKVALISNKSHKHPNRAKNYGTLLEFCKVNILK